MSSKRKDSHPTKSTTITQEEGGGEGEETITTSVGNQDTTWTNGKSTNNGIQNLGSILAQHNGNGVASPSRSDGTREGDGSIAGEDTASIGNKEEEDEDEDEDAGEDKFDNVGDPERLKAFNMFVRLFVDENLDRHVPISKQPKEKIQAIIDSCTRQFPEFSERARKRIRTYLKSCRRTKRSREQAGLDTNNRPTPPHLTSVQAEQLLARACENEAENAKRMRMGLEPISQPLPILTTFTTNPIDMVARSTASPTTITFSSAPLLDRTKIEYKPEQLATLLAASQQQQTAVVSAVSKPEQLATLLAASQQTAVVSAVNSFAPVNGTTAALYRQALQQQQQMGAPSPAALVATGFAPGTAGFAPAVSGAQLGVAAPNLIPVVAAATVNGQPGPPTGAALLAAAAATTNNNHTGGMGADKKLPLLNHKLNGTEMAAVRQLITGYRESAAFLLRSADELENLLQIQPKLGGI